MNRIGGRFHFVPVHRHTTISRPLLCNFAFNGDPALILLHGSAGSGKTLAASQISTSFAERTGSGSVVWVRFRKGEVGLKPVWDRILTSLVEANVLAEDSVARCLVEGGVPSVDEVIEVLRVHPEPLMLVLEDAQHNITAEVEDSIVTVLDTVPRLVITVSSRNAFPILTSQKTLHRIPVRKIGKDRLYFTEDEVVQLVTSRLPDELNPESLGEAIYSKTRGWPFAVHTLLLEREAFPSNEHTPIDRKGSTGLFVKESLDSILKEQDPLGLKIICVIALFGEMTEEILCQVLDISEGECTGILGTDVPFEYWVDESGSAWYSVHEIFNDELHQRALKLLSNTELQTIASKVAQAFREQRPRLAMQAAIMAEEWDLLSGLLLKGTAITLSREQQVVSLTDIPATVLDRYPVIATFALIHEYAFPSGRIGKTFSTLKLLTSKKLVSVSQQPGFPGITATILRMIVARLSGNEDLAIEMAELVTTRIANVSNEEVARYSSPLQIGVNQVAITYIHAGRYFDALTMLERMNENAERLQPKSRAHAAALHAWTVACLGKMNDLPELLQRCEVLGLPVNWRSSYIGAGYRIASAIYSLERNDVVSAQEHVDALAKHRSTIEHWPYLACIETLITEQRDGAGPALTEIEAKMNPHGRKQTPFPSLIEMLAGLHTRLLWNAGKVVHAAKKRQQQSVSSIYAALSHGQDARAGTIASKLVQNPAIASNPRSLSEITLLQGKVALRLGDQQAAAEHARHATSLLNRNGLSVPMRAIPGSTAVALKQFAPELPSAHAAPASLKRLKPLTPAETRTLKAVSEHPSMRAAAESLFLSHDTVKGYMKSIYRKLGVSGKDQALLVATQAGYLEGNDSTSD